jgi:hypothetical protein
MPWRDTQQVCLNGHQITDEYMHSPLERKKFCTECGAGTIFACLVCAAEIPGTMHYERVFITDDTPVPKICHECGNPYPWADKIKKDAGGKGQTIEKKRITPKVRKYLKWGGAIASGMAFILTFLLNWFQVWDLFKTKKEKLTQPVINIKVDPFRFNYESTKLSDITFDLSAKVETGNGVYKFVDSIKVDTLIYLDSSYFRFRETRAEHEVIETKFEKMILGQGVTEQKITFQLKPDFLLDPNRSTTLYLLNKDKQIAIVRLSFPYYFEGNKYSQTIEVPISTYYKSY